MMSNDFGKSSGKLNQAEKQAKKQALAYNHRFLSVQQRVNFYFKRKKKKEASYFEASIVLSRAPVFPPPMS